ncbi:MAG: alpha-L-rhamnosidase N-terminal domain-containing protein, partial [Ruminococcus sp.]|nr:alpha-L-rhamnosidase N-terminal domain-containing protein [Ruminococcus sp.]
MDWNAKWIKPAINMGDVAPVFSKNFLLTKPVKEAKLYITAMGVYEAHINADRIGNFILAPGWTTYKKRLQYQEYDVTNLLAHENTLTVTVGKGWYRSRLVGWQPSPTQKELMDQPCGLLAQLQITYENGDMETILSDES